MYQSRVDFVSFIYFSTESLIYIWCTLLQVGHYKKEDGSQGKHVTNVHAVLTIW